MNAREERMLDQLSRWVPGKELTIFRRNIRRYDALGKQLKISTVNPVDNDRLFLIGRNTWVGGTAMHLLKKHSRKKVLVVYASGRTDEGDKLYPEIMRIAPIIDEAPDDWLVFVGGGKSGMRVARLAAQNRKRQNVKRPLIVAASHFYSESAIQGKSSETHDLDIDFSDLYSREAIFAELGDAFLAALCGLGGVAEDSGVICKTQMKILPQKPFAFLSSEVLDKYLAFMSTLADNGLCKKDDLYYDVLKPADDKSFWQRIAAFEAAHPHLANWQETMIKPGGSPFTLIPPDSGGLATKTA